MTTKQAVTKDKRDNPVSGDIYISGDEPAYSAIDVERITRLAKRTVYRHAKLVFPSLLFPDRKFPLSFNQLCAFLSHLGACGLLDDVVLHFAMRENLCIVTHIVIDGVIYVDPLRRSGQPTLGPSRIPTAILASRWKAGESVESLAVDYDVDEEQIEKALRFQRARP